MTETDVLSLTLACFCHKYMLPSMYLTCILVILQTWKPPFTLAPCEQNKLWGQAGDAGACWGAWMPGGGRRRTNELLFPTLQPGLALQHGAVCGPLKARSAPLVLSTSPHRLFLPLSPPTPSVTPVTNILEHSHSTQICSHFPVRDKFLDAPSSASTTLMQTPASGVRVLWLQQNTFTRTAEVLWRKRDGMATL